ncbi:MAG: hypothetical protein JWM68_3010 [Verrucomicrobiales bacterium]|nr:hypothetical protein [Verrucomicrobiales bacterium]
MRKGMKQVVLGFVVIVILCIGALSLAVYPKFSNMKSEYTTAGVIVDLDAYVHAHPGKWPKSWKDLGDGSDGSAYTKFRFDLSTASMLQNPQLIYEAVTPLRGRYYTYPHAKRQLDEVLRKIKEGTSSPKERK